MKSPEYGFKPLGAKGSGYHLLLLVICLCLLPLSALALDPEFGRIVPDLYGMTVEQAAQTLDKSDLAIEVAGQVRSARPVGTIVRQDPGKDAETTIGAKVNVWVAQRPTTIRPLQPPRQPTPDPLHAEIDPPTLEVRQGEPALFESRSTPRDGISEEWRGPGNQRGTGASFQVPTGGLEPGGYSVVLVVTNNREQRGRTRATLVVTEPAVPPRTPGGGGNNGTEEPRPEYRAMITSDTPEARRSRPVTFTAELNPGRRDAYFRFHFGDETHLETRAVSATHEYETAGSFEAFVEVLGGNHEIIAESNHIVVEVHGPPVISGDGEPPRNHTWLWIGTALLGGIGAGYLLFARRKDILDTGAVPAPRFRAVPRSDAGFQNIGDGTSRTLGPEVGFAPVADSGMQEITSDQEPFIREERRENE